MNVLEEVRHYQRKRIIVVVPDELMNTVAAKSLQSTVVVYRSVYNLSATVAYVPSIPDLNTNSSESSDKRQTDNSINFITKVLEQSELCEKYRLSSGYKRESIFDQTQTAKDKEDTLDCTHMDSCRDKRTNQSVTPDTQVHFDLSLDFQDQENYIFTTYFTSRPDPQRGKTQKQDNLGYILNWFITVKYLGIKAVIFHDGLSENFRKKLQKDYPKVFFEKVSLGKLSTNDARFMIYYDYLIKNPHIKRILCTDVSDVVFINNPFELMTLLGNHLYVGQDSQDSEFMHDNGWFRGMAKSCHVEKVLPEYTDVRTNRYFLNAGVIGGERLLMIDFLNKVNTYIGKAKGKNCNMPVVNYVVQRYFRHAFYTGYPLTSRFRGNNVMAVYVMLKSNYKVDKSYQK